MSYLLGSGYHYTKDEHDEFVGIWVKNTVSVNPLPQHILILTDSNSVPPRPTQDALAGVRYSVVPLHGNLGKHDLLLTGEKTHRFNGWSGCMLALAMIAYTDEVDFVYKESDCLWYGDVVNEMYRQLGDGGIIFGNCLNPDGSQFQECAQSLFLVKHAFIPDFVSTYLASPAQNRVDELGERKFAAMERANPTMWKRFTFGYDRGRPINFNDPIFYVQQLTAEELDDFRARGLV